MIRAIRAAVAAVLLCAAPALAETPLTQTNGALAAQVRVAHRAPRPFLLDTGADGCTVTRATVEAAGLLSLGADRARTPVELDGADLGALDCTLGAVDALGAAALSRFVVVVDTRRMRLSLHGGAQHGQALVGPRARLIYAVTPDGPLAVPVRLNGARGAGIVATGAARSSVSARFAQAAGARPGAPAWLDIVGGAAARVDGGVAETAGSRATMTVGLDRLAGYRLVLDYPRRRIWFDPG